MWINLRTQLYYLRKITLIYLFSNLADAFLFYNGETLLELT